MYVLWTHQKTYSHLSDNRGGWNKYGGGAKAAKLINVEVGKTKCINAINLEWRKI